MVAWIVLQPDEPARDIRHLMYAIPGIFAAILLSYALSRWVSTDAGSAALLVVGVIVISFSDEPSELAVGPALIAYSLPIMAAGMLLPPWSSFLLAALSGAAIFVASLQAPTPLFALPPTLVFFLLALVTWYFASSLERTNRALSRANATLSEDITERKRTEARLRLMSHVVEQSPVAIVLMSQEGRFEYVNPRFTEMTGFSREEMGNIDRRQMRPGDAPPDINQQILNHLAAGKLWRTLSKRTRKDGSWFWEEVSISPVRDDAADSVHYLVIAEDVSVRKEAEDALRNINAELERRVNERTAELLRANVELQQSARLKDEFLATMSHELRTPLTGVLGAADVLGEEVHGPLNARQHEDVRMIHESGRQLLTLINSILDLSRIEAGGMELSIATLNADDVCASALAAVHTQAAAKNLAVSYSAEPTALLLTADAVRLKQILAYLLSNAVKFTPEGGKIGIEVIGDADNEQVHFVVWDTGIGIAPEQQVRLFEPFVQLDGRLNRQYGGAGLGLALVRRFAELHGGGVALESSPGQGSRFTVTLPWRPMPFQSSTAPAAASAVTSIGEAALQEIRKRLGRKPLILLAEDNRTSIEIVLNYLEPLGCELLVVMRGDEAVRTAGERRPDLVLMDIQLPHLNGIAAIRQIRAHPDPKIAKTPILALTALAMQGDRERCIAAGADEYLSKPFTLAALVDLIVRLIGPAAPAAGEGVRG